MTNRQLRPLLYLTAIGLVLIAAGLVAWSTLYPPIHENQTTADDITTTGLPTQPSSQPPPLPDRDAFLTATQHTLRQALFDPPPPPPPRPAPPPPLPQIELISTLLPASGEPSAWIRGPSQGNSPRKVHVGDILGDPTNPATLTAIEADRLLVEHQGEIKPITRTESSGGRSRGRSGGRR